MKKSLLMSTLALSLVSATALPAMDVFAAEGGQKITEGRISFEEDDSKTPPIDPTDPEKPVIPIDPWDPEKPVDPGTDGPLSIDFASSFNFGKQKISVKDETYFADVQHFEDGTSSPNYVQVTDKRGTAEGWNLSVTQDGQFKAGTDELKGAALTLGDQNLNSVLGTEYNPTIVNSSSTLVPGAKTALVSAAKNQGMGTWALYFGQPTNSDAIIEADGSKSVALHVPASAVKLKDKDYTTHLTWELTSAPENGNVAG